MFKILLICFSRHSGTHYYPQFQRDAGANGWVVYPDVCRWLQDGHQMEAQRAPPAEDPSAASCDVTRQGQQDADLCTDRGQRDPAGHGQVYVSGRER